MLRSAYGSGSQGSGGGHLELSVKELLLEDAIYDQQERRSVHREFLFRPVSLLLNETDERVEGFTRNISFLGVSILTRSPVRIQTIATLQIYRISSHPSRFLAECRWLGPFGAEWNLSGWNFMNVELRRTT
jgi:PilZ domain